MILNFQKAIKSKSKNTSTPILLAIMMVCFSFKTFAQFIPSQGIPNLPIDIPANIQLPNLGSSRIQSGSRLDDQPRKQILDPLEKAKQDSITLKNVLRKLTQRLQLEMEKGETLESIQKGEVFNADNVSKITSAISKLADKKVLAFQAMQVMEEFQEFLIRNNQGDFLKQIAMLMPDFIDYMISKEQN